MMESLDLWDEFNYLESGYDEYEENSLYGWCKQNPIKGELILKEWDSTKNIDNNGNQISTKDVYRGSDKKVWWKCSRCGKQSQSRWKNGI